MERDVEKKLVDGVKHLGGECWKWTGRPGVPDRIVMLPGGRVFFVELKCSAGRVSPIQKYTHEKMMNLGLCVLLLYSNEAVDNFLKNAGGEY